MRVRTRTSASAMAGHLLEVVGLELVVVAAAQVEDGREAEGLLEQPALAVEHPGLELPLASRRRRDHGPGPLELHGDLADDVGMAHVETVRDPQEREEAEHSPAVLGR